MSADDWPVAYDSLPATDYAYGGYGFSPDASQLAAGGDGAVSIYSTADWTVAKSLSEPSDIATSTDYSPNGDFLAAGSHDSGSVYVYSAVDYSLVTELTDPELWVQGVHFSPDSSLLAVAARSTTAYIYDTSDWSLTATLSEPGDYIQTARFSHSGSRLALGSGSGLYVYDTSDWSLIDRPKTNSSYAASWSADDGFVAIGDSNGNTEIFDTSDWSTETTIDVTGGHVRGGTWSPDGQFLTQGTSYGNVKIIDTADWSISATLQGNTQQAYFPRFSPDGEFLNSADRQNPGTVYEATLVEIPTYTVEGEAVLDGDPLSNATVYAIDEAEPSILQSTETAGDGSYGFEFEEQREVLLAGGIDLSGSWHSMLSRRVTAGEGSLSVIPDSVVHRWYVPDLGLSDGDTISTIPDLEGDADLSATGDPIYQANEIGDNGAAVLDGTDDWFDSTIPQLDNPVTIFAVQRADVSSGRRVVTDGIDDPDPYLQYNFNDSRYEVNDGSGQYIGGTPSQDAEIAVFVIDGSNSFLRINGTEVLTADFSSSTMEDGITWGRDRRGQYYWDGPVGELYIDDQRTPDSAIQEQEQRLADDWGISV